MHYVLTSETQILVRFALRPALFVSIITMRRMISNDLEHLTVKSTLYVVLTHRRRCQKFKISQFFKRLWQIPPSPRVYIKFGECILLEEMLFETLLLYMVYVKENGKNGKYSGLKIHISLNNLARDPRQERMIFGGQSVLYFQWRCLFIYSFPYGPILTKTKNKF